MSNFVKTYLCALGGSGFLAALRTKKDGPGVLFTVKKRGIRHPFFVRLHSSDVPACKQVFFDREYRFRVKNPPRFIIDAGANIGLASLYFANRFPETKIIAIEPEVGNFTLLRKNVAPYANITPVNAALWNESREIDLVDPGLGNWGFMTRDEEKTPGDESCYRHRVMAMTVDEIIKESGFSRVDILKMDIEGAEREVLADAGAWLEQVDSMIVELHERMKSGCEASFAGVAGEFAHQWRQGENLYLSRGGECLCPQRS